MPQRPRTAPPSSGPGRLRGELVRVLGALDRQIERALEHVPLTPGEVHDLHRDLRRLASGLTVWGRLLPADTHPEAREVAGRLRRLARLVGRVRDRDVTASLLAPISRGGRVRPPPEAWREFLGQLREDSHTGRELLRAFLRTERQGGLFERARGLLATAPRGDAGRGLHHILAEERRRRQARVRRAQRKARRDPTGERLHRLRIRIRQWRHLASLEGLARATANHPPPLSWRRLQDRLGRLHDLDVAVATIPEGLAGSVPALRLKEVRRELRRAVRLTLERIAARGERAAATARGAA